MKRNTGAFLVCDGCGYCCYVQGLVMTSLQDAPPPCPGCSAATRVARRAPWRDDPEALGRVS